MTDETGVTDDDIRDEVVDFYHELGSTMTDDLPTASMEEIQEFLETAMDVRDRARELLARRDAVIAPPAGRLLDDETTPRYVLAVFVDELQGEMPGPDDAKGIADLVDACQEAMIAVSAMTDVRAHAPTGPAFA